MTEQAMTPEEIEYAKVCNTAANISNHLSLSIPPNSTIDQVLLGVGMFVGAQCMMNNIPVQYAAMMTGQGLDIAMANGDKAKIVTPPTGGVNA